MAKKSSIAFIVRVKPQGTGWHVLLHNLITAEQQSFKSFEACSQAMLKQASMTIKSPKIRKENR